MLHTSEAIYISSNFKNTVIFDYHHNIGPDLKDGSYEPLVNTFMHEVRRFGKEIEFPKELVCKIDEGAVDRMMLDCEFHPEKAFFIVIEESSKYISVIDDQEFILWGGNDTHLVFESKTGGKITILPMKEAKKYFLCAQKEVIGPCIPGAANNE